jgi:hypothetical protein
LDALLTWPLAIERRNVHFEPAEAAVLKRTWKKDLDRARSCSNFVSKIRRSYPLSKWESPARWSDALRLTLREANLFGVELPKNGRTDEPTYCLKLSIRLRRWFRAFTQYDDHAWSQLCDDYVALRDSAKDEDSQLAEAARFGWLASQPELRRDPQVLHYADKSRSMPKRTEERFNAWMTGRRVGRWKHRELDTWLIFVWPFLEENGWTRRMIFPLAREAFPGYEGSKIHRDCGLQVRFFRYPLDRPDHLQSYCKSSLHLEFIARGMGKPRNLDFPTMCKFALILRKKGVF